MLTSIKSTPDRIENAQRFDDTLKLIFDLLENGPYEDYAVEEEEHSYLIKSKIIVQKKNIDHILITIGVPQGNRQIERLNRTIISSLSALSVEEPEKWFKYVERLQQILYRTNHRSTAVSPFKVFTGIDMRYSEDLKSQELLEKDLIQRLDEERSQVRDDAAKQIARIQEENKRNYNKRRKKARVYEVGDWVAVQRTQFESGLKLRIKLLGPYKVIK
nr:uncharacterized protein LOC111423000 [Onthophagus taurus]